MSGDSGELNIPRLPFSASFATVPAKTYDLIYNTSFHCIKMAFTRTDSLGRTSSQRETSITPSWSVKNTRPWSQKNSADDNTAPFSSTPSFLHPSYVCLRCSNHSNSLDSSSSPRFQTIGRNDECGINSRNSRLLRAKVSMKLFLQDWKHSMTKILYCVNVFHYWRVDNL